jgi:hypothetical protein
MTTSSPSSVDNPNLAIRPVNSVVNSGYGWRIHPITHTKKHHDGLDMAIATGTPVLAAASGTVLKIRTDTTPGKGYGNMITLDHGNGWTTGYAHLSKILCKVGDEISPGQKIGLVGTTGGSTGPHLHFEVRANGAPQDPRDFLPPLPAKDAVSGVLDRPSPPWTVRPQTPAEHYLMARVELFLETDRLATLSDENKALEERMLHPGAPWSSFDEAKLTANRHALATARDRRRKLAAVANDWQEQATTAEYLEALNQAFIAQWNFNAKAAQVPYPLLQRDKDQLAALNYLKGQLKDFLHEQLQGV